MFILILWDVPQNTFHLMSVKGHGMTINTMSNVMQSHKAVEECIQSMLPCCILVLKRPQQLSPQNTKIRQAAQLCITVATGCSRTVAILDWAKCRRVTVQLQPKKEHRIGFIVLSLRNTKPEVTQVIIVHKRSDTTKCTLSSKTREQKNKGSFHQCKISHA